MLLAEKVFTDERTKQKIIVGTFDTIFFRRPGAKGVAEIDVSENPEEKRKISMLPGVSAGDPYVYINLTEIHTSCDLELRYVNLKDNSVLIQVKIRVESPSPLATAEIDLPLALSRYSTEEGVFSLELLHGDEPLGSLRITVREAKGKNE